MFRENVGLSFSSHLVLPFLWRSCSEQKFWAFQDHCIPRYMHSRYASPCKHICSRILERNLVHTLT